MTFVVAVVLGLVLARALPPALAPTPPRLWLLLPLAAGLQLLVPLLPAATREEAAPWALFATNAAVGVFLLHAVVRRGSFRVACAVAAAGWLLNALVVALNGGMPVSASAARTAGFESGIDVAEGFRYEHVPLEDTTVLPALGDVIPVPAGPLREVISPGDVLLAAGISLAAARLSRKRLGELEKDKQREEVM